MKRIKKYLALTGLVAATALLLVFGFASSGSDDEKECGDFIVSGDEANYRFEDGVLTITGGNVGVRNKSSVAETTNRIIVDGDATVILAGVNIVLPEVTSSKPGAPIQIKPGRNVTLELANESYNYVSGEYVQNGNKISGSAGVEVGLDTVEDETGKDVGTNFATLTITGNGTLEAHGGANGAGIGGSKELGNKTAHGNIVIESGTILAYGGTDAAGIGTGSNMNSQLSNGSYRSSFNWGSITINGGNITAVGNGMAAGIGGGNHVDSGKITINGGTIDATGNSGIGCGYGSHRAEPFDALTKGPGYYYADITITGGDITATASHNGTTNDGGAGIGGGMYSDAIINISGGTIKAYGGTAKAGSYHHGGAGIGGGYEGHAEVTITGGDIIAVGGCGGSGIGSGAIPNQNMNNKDTRGYKCRAGEATLEYTDISISGGTIVATGGVSGGAGIGGGVGADKAAISITGGDITATGAAGSKDTLNYNDQGSSYSGGRGGAGIGSGYSGTTSGENSVYFETTDELDISITGGKVIAIGGWGASGVGSGADNTIATTINIDFENTDIQAYADGTKFAIDTRDLHEDGSTFSYTEGRTVTGNMLQGTFVHAYENAGMDQNPEGLKSIQVINDATGESKELKLMPDGYRSYATGVSEPGVYTVYTDEESIGKGEGRYFSKQSTDVFNKAEADQPGNIVQYTVENGKLSDNFYLFPVKTVVVEKVVNGPEEGTEGLNMTAYFALKIDNELVKPGDEDKYIQIDGRYFMKDGNGLWTESIDIKDGVPQSKAYFVNVDDLAYDVWEVDGKNSTNSPQDAVFGAYTLKSITTQHGGTIEATADGHTKGAFTVTKTDEGDKAKISVEVDFDKTEGLEWITVSLFADGKLLSEPSKSLSKTGDHTASWTVDKSKDGKEIVYAVADTSNNSVISQNQWSDEVTIINTYTTKKLPVDVTVKLTKELAAYYNAGKDARATAVFLITVTDKDGEKLAERYVSYVFKKTGEQTKTVTFKKLEGPTQLTIEEVYSSGYKGVIKGTSDTKAVYDLTDPDLDLDKPIELTFVNTPGKRKYTDGVINTYKNKKFDTSSDEEGE